MGVLIEALIEGALMAILDPTSTQVGFNLISVQVCNANLSFTDTGEIHTLNRTSNDTYVLSAELLPIFNNL